MSDPIVGIRRPDQSIKNILEYLLSPLKKFEKVEGVIHAGL